MKAAYLTGHGGNEVVAVGERPLPQRAPGEVRVRLHAATLNRVDLYMRDSGAGITHSIPQTMGVDGAGVIDEVGADEPSLRPGQRVLLYPGVSCGRCEFCLRGDDVLCTRYQLLGEHRDGTFADYVCAPARNAVPLPDDWSFAEGAALGVNHLTAWRMLVTQARLKPWETVLVFGIGGGVSLAGLQLAKALGARVIVTSRHAGKLAQARALGADHVIDSSQEDVAKAALAATGGRGVDVVFENVGEAVWPAAMKALVRGGRLVTCGATSGDQPGADLRRLFIRQLQVLGSTLGNLSELHDLLAFCQRHDVRPVIEQSYALDDVHAALSRLESGEQFGKIALAIA
ncbi:zinc-binding dehydrogenase [Ottowia sp. GY511]|uniref:Zinc-binding dehydrogenase n=1 Tax=Ottowia flava TaxID=2675430 RepID=A0ABW4KVC3_9BURK|nr:zinc-binding dehydrogenase [Ottowia sp. GY511]TXK31403.1 zinc-binding dehydrogenase [Ottowia sp. GY511]